ncbi:MAG: sigma-70 family RNA polymerase sigma factor [Brevinematales bacterium]|nr:sigma-70 family RNA polymerase sigma factor [Brevinematales bacterium]
MERYEVRNVLLKYLSKDIAKTKVIEEDLITIIRAKKGDREAIRKIIENNIRFVVKLASNFRVQNDVFMDLISEGCLGIMRAIKNYDISKGVKFSSYANIWIKHYILSYLSSNSVVKLPARKKKMVKSLSVNNSFVGVEESLVEYNMSVEEYQNMMSLNNIMFFSDISDESVITNKRNQVDEKIEFNHLVSIINEKVSKLSPKEQFIIEHRYGLNNKEVKRLVDIARIFKSTPEGIRYIEQKALSKLRVMLEKESII